jgi:hypothetical protein
MGSADWIRDLKVFEQPRLCILGSWSSWLQVYASSRMDFSFVIEFVTLRSDLSLFRDLRLQTEFKSTPDSVIETRSSGFKFKVLWLA